MSIEIRDVSYDYIDRTLSFGKDAVCILDNINLTIPTGTVLGLVGGIGSGKSTLAHIMSGLLKLKNGTEQSKVLIAGNKPNPGGGIGGVGILMQHPEDHMFEQSVYDDVAFAPRNLKLDEDEVHKRVMDAMRIVGFGRSHNPESDIDYAETILKRPPFELSHGEKRRVALAGVLAMSPKHMILDEPAANLDPQSRQCVLDMIENLREQGMTIVIISHRVSEILDIVDNIAFLDNGKIVFSGTRDEFIEYQASRDIAWIMSALKARGFCFGSNDSNKVFSALSPRDAAALIAKELRGHRDGD